MLREYTSNETKDIKLNQYWSKLKKKKSDWIFDIYDKTSGRHARARDYVLYDYAFSE